MSTIRVDNFAPSAGGTTYSARGIAKSWVNFDGTGTIAIRDSENVASLTDNGTGDYTVNFSNAFDVADYSVSGSARVTVSFPYGATLSLKDGKTKTTSALSVQVTGLGNDGTLYGDGSEVNAQTFGDLA